MAPTLFLAVIDLQTVSLHTIGYLSIKLCCRFLVGYRDRYIDISGIGLRAGIAIYAIPREFPLIVILFHLVVSELLRKLKHAIFVSVTPQHKAIAAIEGQRFFVTDKIDGLSRTNAVDKSIQPTDVRTQNVTST